ncbi:MAG: bifunctional glutamate N-acetyltransferase/amino-acid acetyltransferase ArgJ [bacterium]
MEGITSPKGFKAAGVRCGIKTRGKDLAMIVSDYPASCAGVFTTNRVQAASVVYSREVVSQGRMRAIVVNSGCANCCTGQQGEANNRRMAILASEVLDIPSHEIAIASTGVIGAQLPMNQVETGIRQAARLLTREAGGNEAAEAIMTTDLAPKKAASAFEIEGNWVRIGGIAKGSGMIAPNMATMLAFLTTDALISPALLQNALASATDRSFNCMTVDGDTSTNDSLIIMANGASKAKIEPDTPAYEEFYNTLETVCISLAKQVARDGEGATKLIEILVKGAPSQMDARKVGKTIGESPLVKTAMFGSDPNWGRIMAAAGRSGVTFDPDDATLDIVGSRVFEYGQPTSFNEAEVSQMLRRPEVSIVLDLGAGQDEATVWTCDLSMDYIRINADYRT